MPSHRSPYPFRHFAAFWTLAALLHPQIACANDEDFQQWTQISATGSVKGRLLAYAEIQTRLTNDANRIGQLFVRPAIGYQIDDNTSVLVGYAYVRSEPLGRSGNDEHRAWQEINFKLADLGKLAISSRARIEQRTIIGAQDTGWRYRHQIRAQFPIHERLGLTGVVWSEPFYNFNSTDWGARQGMDRWRNFGGVAVPVNARSTVQLGYLNQYVFRAGADRIDHIASAKVFHRF